MRKPSRGLKLESCRVGGGSLSHPSKLYRVLPASLRRRPGPRLRPSRPQPACPWVPAGECDMGWQGPGLHGLVVYNAGIHRQTSTGHHQQPPALVQ
eukprot:scaffold131720_cov26-Prasinocladus_malaysianus.AAC.2